MERPLHFSAIAQLMKQVRATDIHLDPESPPLFRVDGELQACLGKGLTAEETTEMIRSVMTEPQWKKLQENWEVDFSFEVAEVGHLRANIFYKRGQIAGAFRYIPDRIPSFSELGLPPVVERLAELPKGLVLITGATGSGKSTTLAAVVDRINQTRRTHIVTIEDPIEYVHRNKNALISQREVFSDTRSFQNALRSTLRQDPNVVLVGEMRDLESIDLTLTIAETGHLTFATLHTNSTVQTITRLIDVFPEGQQSQVRTQLSFVLQGILCQQLIPHASGKGRVLALEILVVTPAIRNMVREGKIHQIYSVIQSGQNHSGMQTMNQALMRHLKAGEISLKECLSRTTEPEEFQEMIKRERVTIPS